MEHLYIGIPRKVLVVEGQNVLDTMHAHCRYEACVVNLHAGDAVRYQESPPFLVNREAVDSKRSLSSKVLVSRSVSLGERP